MEHSHEPSERRWECREQEDNDENEPDVICLPDRSDRLGDERPLLIAARARCQ